MCHLTLLKAKCGLCDWPLKPVTHQLDKFCHVGLIKSSGQLKKLHCLKVISGDYRAYTDILCKSYFNSKKGRTCGLCEQ